MAHFKQNLLLKLFSLFKIPLIFFVSPQIIELNNDSAKVKIPLNRKTKNHLKSMYFGALCIGADLVLGVLALHHINKSKHKISLVFKDFSAEFLKRPESDVVFEALCGQQVKEMVLKVVASGVRQSEKFEILAYCPKKLGREPVAKFSLSLSLKLQLKEG